MCILIILPSIPHNPHRPPPPPAAVAEATRGGSADVRDSSKDTDAGAGSGDMYRCWASTNTQEQNGRHPRHTFCRMGESLWALNKTGSAPVLAWYLFFLLLFSFWWCVWYGWCGIFSVWLVWPKRITGLSCLSPTEISCLSEEFRSLPGYLSAFTSMCAFVFECVRTLVSSGWH